MADDTARRPPEWLHGVGGRVTGGIVIVVVLLLVLLGVLAEDLGYTDWFFAALVLVVVLAWGSMARPAVGLEPDHLVVRSMFETVRVPLLAITDAEVRHVLVVTTDERRVTSSAIGRTRRQQRRDARPGAGGLAGTLSGGRAPDVRDPDASYGLFVEQRIAARIADARVRAGLPEKRSDADPTPPPVQRTLAWPEVVVTALAVLALVVTVLT